MTYYNIIQMAVSFIQIGQCGNQIGSNFYNIMFEQGIKASQGHQALLSQFFTTTNSSAKSKPKAFLIDMQPKVVNRNLALKKAWQYDKKLSLVREEGSGNNWAYGCNIHGKHIKEELIEMFRSYAEREDYLKSFVQFQSMAGGTGSGIGTYIIRLLNTLFPKTPKFVTCVMPHLSGQVIVQSYNICLSLSTIYQQSDGIFVIQNDQMNTICTKQLNIAKPLLQDINEVIGRNLAAIYFPVVGKDLGGIYSTDQSGIDYGIDFGQNLFMDNRYKLCSIRTAPHGPKNSQGFNSDSWHAVQGDLISRRKMPHKGRMLIYRGSDTPPSYCPTSPQIFHDKHIFYNYNRSCTLLENSSSFVNSLDRILDKGYSMLKEDAYIYQYQKYGLSKQQMLECFGVVENIQNCYKKL